jgi:hypothetical protein
LEPRRGELVDPLRLVHVLELVLAEVPQRDIRRRVVAEELARRRGDEHLAAVAGGGDARGAVDAHPDVALAADGRLAGVNAHPHTQLAAAGPFMCGQRLLRVDSGADGVLRAAKRREERVALRVDLGAVVGCERVANDPLVVGERGRVVVAQLSEQARRALDVGEEEGDCPGRPLRPGTHGLVVAPKSLHFV